MKRFSYASIVTAALLGAGLMTAPLNAQNQTNCEDRVTGGGYIIIPGEEDGNVFANFGAGGGIHQGDLWGYLTFVFHGGRGPVVVSAQEVTAYCQGGCAPEGCEVRRITYANATVRLGPLQLEGVTVIVEVSDCSEPGTDDTFAICIPSEGVCFSGVLGGDEKPSGGNIQLHQPDPTCESQIPICEDLLESCPCFTVCD